MSPTKRTRKVAPVASVFPVKSVTVQRVKNEEDNKTTASNIKREWYLMGYLLDCLSAWYLQEVVEEEN